MIFSLLVVGLLVVVLIVSLLRGRHGEDPAAANHWTATGEVFRDPSTGRVMRVWLDPADQSRHYVPEP